MIERVIKPNIDVFNSFTVDNFLDTKYKDGRWVSAVLPRKVRLTLTNIGKFKSAFIENKTVKVYVDKEDNSLWYYNPAMYNGYMSNDEGGTSYFSLAGWSKITGVRKLLEEGYTPLKIKSALTLYILEVDKDITQLYEDILLEAIQMYSKYLEINNREKVENKKFEVNKMKTKQERIDNVELSEYIKKEIEKELIKNRFTYHSPKPKNVPKFEKIREAARDMAVLLVDLCPTSPELTEALNKLDETVMYANASISRHS